MNNRILVPLDGSKLAEMALPHAAALAHANGYDLTLLRGFRLCERYGPGA